MTSEPIELPEYPERRLERASYGEGGGTYAPEEFRVGLAGLLKDRVGAGTGAGERSGAGVAGGPGGLWLAVAPTGRLGIVIFDFMLVGVLADEVGEAMAERGENGVSWLRPAASGRGGVGRSFLGAA